MARSLKASKVRIEKANAAFKITGWSQDRLAGLTRCSRPVVINFFAGQPVDKSIFQAIRRVGRPPSAKQHWKTQYGRGDRIPR